MNHIFVESWNAFKKKKNKHTQTHFFDCFPLPRSIQLAENICVSSSRWLKATHLAVICWNFPSELGETNFQNVYKNRIFNLGEASNSDLSAHAKHVQNRNFV